MADALRQPDPDQRLSGTASTVADALVDQRQFDLFQRAQTGKQAVRLEDEAEGATAQSRAGLVVELGDILVREEIASAGWTVEHADDVHHRALAGTGLAHDGEEFAALDFQADLVQRAQLGTAG